jgi:hypothetical protein
VAKRKSSNEFWERYKHPNWQRKRLEIMERAGFRCQECGDDEKTLNVHHSYYERELDPWEYPDDSLWCLCEECHKQYGEAKAELNRAVSRLSLSQLKQVIGFANGLEMEEGLADRKYKADCYEKLLGMIRVYVTLNHRELGRYVTEVIQFIDEDEREVCAGMLIAAVRVVVKKDWDAKRPSAQMTYVEGRPERENCQ